LEHGDEVINPCFILRPTVSTSFLQKKKKKNDYSPNCVSRLRNQLGFKDETIKSMPQRPTTIQTLLSSSSS
jgi:hypothetical protein